MRNGPYLVTNLTRLTDCLGASVGPAPQLALCRCGASAIKPLCDGSHARTGFSDAKDPSRVPDRRDTYEGQQVTVFDNRGICQHSGLCTDRLAGVFRTDAEPFVAPSGGRMDEIIRAVRNCPSGALSYALDAAEARDQVDRHGERGPDIEVTKDGPYRVTGSLPLTGPGGSAVAMAAGASLEHYALCRCGQSQNKPFCSGMHWYVEFRDPELPAGYDLSPFEWAGGLPALRRLADLLYEKHVPADPLLAPLFGAMPPGQPEVLAAWLAAALGGPPAGPDGPAAPAVVGAGPGDFTEERRARWAVLAAAAADDAKLPADAAFRSVLTACLDWLSRTSAAGGPAEAEDAAQAVPRWDWGPGGRPAPDGRREASPQDQDADVTLPGPQQAVSFAAHVKPLFRARDRQSMSFAFDLWSLADARAHGPGILARLRDGTMPCDGAWPAERIEVFGRWLDSGANP